MLAAQQGFEPSAFVLAEQIHGNVVEYISPEKRGRGAFSRSTALPHCDAMITHHRNICLVAQAANCVPILFYDPVREAFPDSWQAVLQPSASGKHIFNLWQANRQTLLEAGICPENLEVAGIFTRCNNHQFFSARAGDRGRFGTIIMLR